MNVVFHFRLRALGGVRAIVYERLLCNRIKNIEYLNRGVADKSLVNPMILS